MCGIYGYFGTIKRGQHKKVLKLMKALAIETEIRGIHSTGFYARSRNFELMEKQAVKASVFVKTTKLMAEAILTEKAHVFMGHNRKASIGKVNNDNAHPFVGDRLTLVHNGTTGEIFDLISKANYEKMEGETDSEAMMLHFNEVGPEDLNTWKELDSYAVVMYDNKTNQVYFARDDGRPMAIFDLRKKFGIRVFASTPEIAKRAFNKIGMKTGKIPFFRFNPFALYKGDPVDGEIHKVGIYKGPRIIRQTSVGPCYESPEETVIRTSNQGVLVVHSND